MPVQPPLLGEQNFGYTNGQHHAEQQSPTRAAYNHGEQQSPTRAYNHGEQQSPLLASFGDLNLGGPQLASYPHMQQIEQQMAYTPEGQHGAYRATSPGGARTQGWQQNGAYGEQQAAYAQQHLGHANTWHGASDKRVFWNC